MRELTIKFLLFTCAFVIFTSCTSLKQLAGQNEESAVNKTTTETVPKEIRKGMTASEVQEVLGANKNVLTDNKGRSVLMYDRLSTTSVKKDRSDRDILLLVTVADKEGEKDYRDKAFTIIIRFDNDGKADGVDFYPSRF